MSKDSIYALVKRHGKLKSRRRIIAPKTVVLHHTAGGTISGAESALKKRGLGYHYMIDKDGTVFEYVLPSRRTAHAYRNNTGTVGVSYVGGGTFGPCNRDQYINMVELLKDIREKYPTIKNVTGHKHIDPRGWKIDPRWTGEPANGINWDIDKKFMIDISNKTGLNIIWHKARRHKDGSAKY